jgi:mono/diheme cytochrome c family protein
MLISLGILAIPFLVGMLFTYEVINIDWISFMEVQPSFRPMEMPLPVPEDSVPIEGAAYVSGIGSPDNPLPADEASLQRGRVLFDINCRLCHGLEGRGDGSVAAYLKTVPPRDLTDESVKNLNDGDIFLTITNGKPFMPPLGENLFVHHRWDVVNYVRQLQGAE